MKTAQVLSALGLTVILCGAACAGPVEKPSEQGQTAAAEADPNAAAVTVNGTILTNGRVSEELEKTMGMIRRQAPHGVPPEMLGELRRQVVDMLINRALVEEAAKAEKIVVSPSEIDEEMKKAAEKFPDQSSFEKHLAESGVTLDQLGANIKLGMEMDKLMAAHVPAGAPTEAEMKDFFEKNMAKMAEPEKVRASHILVKIEKGESDEAKKEKRAKIDGLLAQINSGADFAETARRNSDDASKADGGDLGLFARGQMVKPFEEAAFALKKGETSGVVETEFGYHIIRVTERIEAKTPTFEESKDKISAHIEQQKRSEAGRKYLEGLRGKAKIEYAPGEAQSTPGAGGKPGLPPGHP